MTHTPMTSAEMHTALKEGRMTVRQLVADALAVIEQKDGDVHAFVELYNTLDEQIAYAESLWQKGEATALTGIPIALKDNICYKGQLVTASSQILAGYRATYDADIVESLKAVGAILIGRTNMDEFAMGSSTETSVYGPTRNPVDITRVPGGSSGGSAASVAMGAVPIAIGSDTGGSIRQPAGLCGVIGFKPTYGSISRFGLLSMGSSLDILGPFTRSVQDAEILFTVVARPDVRDATALTTQERVQVARPVRRVGVPRSFISIDGLDSETRANFEVSLDKLRALGYEVVDIDVPLIEYSLPVYYILMPAEASTNFARYDGIRFGHSVPGATPDELYKATRTSGFGDEVKRRILTGTYVLSHGYYDAYYTRALELQKAIRQSLGEVFSQVDIIATPATPAPAFTFGAKKDPVSMYLCDIFAVPANIAGVPAISVPAGTTSQGLPLDIQFMATHNGEGQLFAIAKDFLGEVY